MNDQSFTLAERLIPSTYLQQAASSKRARENLIRALIENQKLPEDGWDDVTIEIFMADLALMDSNNFLGNSGVGEREARFASSLVARRHYRLGHGIGRSGDIGEVQPKAAGSSLLSKLTNALLLDVIRFVGTTSSAGCILVPMATGMSLVLCMLTFKQDRPAAKFVLWSRIDQKSCFKCILTCGLQPIIIEPVMTGDELQTNASAFESQMSKLGSSNIACVLSTTSCFAPRASDSITEIAELCSRYSIPHLINNAYGLQSSRLMQLIDGAAKKGRVDAFVQSTDKNFLVPVGGTIISGFDKELLERISSNYPGRASASPTIDVFMTLLSLGRNGYRQLIVERIEMFQYLKEELGRIAAKHGERILVTSNNPISMAMTLASLRSSGDDKQVSFLGSMLFLRCVSGTRCITGTENINLATHYFEGWGAHHSNAPCPYITAAAGIGMKKLDVDRFIFRLDKAMVKVRGLSSAIPISTTLPRLISPCRRPSISVDNCVSESKEEGLRRLMLTEKTV